MLLGELDGEIVSVVTVLTNRHSRVSSCGDLGITVRKPCWGIGIGRAMLTELGRRGREHGLRYLHLEVRDGNSRARGLYESIGFRETGRWTENFFLGGEYSDSILMEWCLL